MSWIPVPVATIGLVVASNVFMTFAWYGRLKFKTALGDAAEPRPREPGAASSLPKYPDTEAAGA